MTCITNTSERYEFVRDLVHVWNLLSLEHLWSSKKVDVSHTGYSSTYSSQCAEVLSVDTELHLTVSRPLPKILKPFVLFVSHLVIQMKKPLGYYVDVCKAAFEICNLTDLLYEERLRRIGLCPSSYPTLGDDLVLAHSIRNDDFANSIF